MLRRCFRVLPLCWFVVLLVALAHLPVGHTRDGRFVAVSLTGAPLLYNLLTIQNLTGTESAIATLWSLPYETQMYLLLPALSILAQASPARVVLWIWLATAMTAACFRFDGADRVRDALWLVPCFYAGIVAFRLTRHTRPTWPALTWPMRLVRLTLLYLAWPKPSVGALACLALGVCQPRIRELRLRPLRLVSQLIARYSYGVYLTHLICLWLAFEYVPDAPLVLRWALFVATAVAVPVVLYHGLEQPMVALGAQLAARLRRRELQKAAFS
jgi:peptidoglycan/LPS O-acetylase OafA/YrhL